MSNTDWSRPSIMSGRTVEPSFVLGILSLAMIKNNIPMVNVYSQFMGRGQGSAHGIGAGMATRAGAASAQTVLPAQAVPRGGSSRVQIREARAWLADCGISTSGYNDIEIRREVERQTGASWQEFLIAADL